MTNIPSRSKKDVLVNRKLTDFFAPNSSPPSASLPVSSSKAPSTTPTTSTRFRQFTSSSRPVTRASKAATERNSASASSHSSNSATSHSLLPSSHSLTGVPSRQTRSTSAMTTRASLKRARSPDNHLTTSHIVNAPVPKLKSPIKRMRKFESDSEVDAPQAVIYVTSPSLLQNLWHFNPCHPPPLTGATSPLDSSKQVVYSSQSDEMELVLPIPESRDHGKVHEDVQKWRQSTFHSSNSPIPQPQNDATEVGPLAPSSPPASPVASVIASSPHFDDSAHIRSVATSVSSIILPETHILPATCLPSPPDTDAAPPLPPTPKALDKDSKTAKLIADIKARAFAVKNSSDDEKTLEFRELEDSDDDDLDDDLLPVGQGMGKSDLSPALQGVFSSPLSSLPSPSLGSTSRLGKRGDSRCLSPQPSPSQPRQASGRYRKPAPAFRLPTTVAESSTSVGVSASTSVQSRKKGQAPNPLDALLREKKNEDKRGTSSAALRLAEAAVKQGSRETSVNSGDSPYGTSFSLLDLADERAAWKAVREPSSRKSLSPYDAFSDTEDPTLGTRETKILGTVAGEAINKILEGDKTSKGKERAQIAKRENAVGVPLWVLSSDEAMEVDSRPAPDALLGEGHPIFARLEQLYRSGDNSLLVMVLSSGVLGVMPSEILTTNVSQLLYFVLFASSQFADAAYIALRGLWELGTVKVQLPFSAIASALARLGARPSIFEELGWPTDASAQKDHFTPESRVTAVIRLLAIVKAAAHAGAFFCGDIANVVLSLVLIRLDISTSNDLRMQLNVTMDAVCNHNAEDLFVHSAIHETVLSFAKNLNAVNKAQLVSFFGSGGGRSRHIAQWLAYCILVPTSIPLTDQLPSLDPLILMLSPEAGSGELFDVTSDATDYEDLGHYVTILAVALADIAPYVREERTITQSASIDSVESSPGKAKKPVLPLELLRRVLEVVQGKIVDTRAAHLDRSRAKAAMQRLTMRIYYERLAIKGVSSRARTSTLQSYFATRP
ncbi:hypothetical protein BU15DRAFT_73249 [Melanogaster broomeanus]|nr:hypothetical protein BU15DRAFT_73249 [Melanogaster broomeanus]